MNPLWLLLIIPATVGLTLLVAYLIVFLTFLKNWP